MLRPLRQFTVVDKFVELFDGRVLLRRPVLVIVGGTNTGKSILAEDVLRRVATTLGLASFVEVTVEADEHLDFHDFQVDRHAGVLLDGVADALTIKRHREILQGRAKTSYGARSATMVYAYLFSPPRARRRGDDGPRRLQLGHAGHRPLAQRRTEHHVVASGVEGVD